MEYNFNIGDRVFMYNSFSRMIKTVENITPKGFIRVDGHLFTSDGYERGARSSCPSWYIEPVTPEKEKEFKENIYRKRIIKRCQDANWNGITFEQAQLISEILDKLGF